jgi:potassium efflux system protein
MNKKDALLKYFFAKHKLGYLLLSALFFAVSSSAALAQDTAKAKTDTALSVPDTLLFRIQKAQAAITEINATNKRGYGIDNMAWPMLNKTLRR